MKLNKPCKILLLFSAIFILISNESFCQNRQEWKIVKIVNTFLQVGVAEPIDIDFKSAQKMYLRKRIYIHDSLLFFSKYLHSSDIFTDTVYIRECKTYQVAKGNDQTFRYPGDELGCIDGHCFVGETFMKLLGLSKKSLTFCRLRGNSPNYFSYKLCTIVKNKKIGLLLDNAFLILILERVK